jgi:hypothetical protein
MTDEEFDENKEVVMAMSDGAVQLLASAKHDTEEAEPEAEAKTPVTVTAGLDDDDEDETVYSLF